MKRLCGLSLLLLHLAVSFTNASEKSTQSSGGCVITATSTQVCPGTQVTMSVNPPPPPGLVTWSNGNISPSISVIVNGTAQFFAYVIDEFGVPCTSSVTIFVSNIQVNLSSQNSGCAGSSTGSAEAAPTNGFPPYTYFWSNSETTQSVSGLGQGGFSVLVTDDAGCTATASGSIQELSAVGGPINIANEPSCTGGDGTAFVVPFGGSGSGYTFLWSNGETDAQVSSLDAGPFSVTITDDLGCTAFYEDTMNAANSITSVLLSFQDPSCNGALDGSISVDTILGGSPPYQIGWSNGASGNDVTGLPADFYDVYIVDADNCFFLQSITLTDPDPIDAIASLNQPDCFGTATGSIVISSLSGGTLPYSFSWTNGANTQDLNNVSAGSYGVTISDQNGCQQSYLYNLLNPPPIPIGSILGPPTAVEYSSGSYEVLQISSVSYNWSISGGSIDSGATDATVYVTWNFTGTGMLYVTAFDSVSGCSLTDSLTVTITQPVGLHDGIDLTNLQAFPNPFEHSINLNVISNDLILQLYSTDGKLVAEQRGGVQLNGLDYLEAGLYALKVSSPDGRQYTLKLIKSKS